MIILEFAITTLHFVREILFYSPQYFYNYLIDLIYINCCTLDGIYVLILISAKNTNLKTKNLKIHFASHLIQLVLYSLSTMN